MTKANGAGRVTPGQLFAELTSARLESHEVELRLSAQIDRVTEAIHQNRLLSAEALARLEKGQEAICARINGHDKDIETLETSQRNQKWWNFGEGIFIAIGTALGVAFGPKGR